MAGSDANKNIIVEKRGLDRLINLSARFSDDPSVILEVKKKLLNLDEFRSLGFINIPRCVADHVNHHCTVFEITGNRSTGRRSWGRRACDPSNAKVSGGAAHAKERMFHDPQSCCEEPRKQASLSFDSLL